jgi:hypothetical protein
MQKPMTPVAPVQSARCASKVLPASIAVKAGPRPARTCLIAARMQRIHGLP